MSRRLVAFIAVVFFTALPISKVVCEANCARGAASMGPGHACCHDAHGTNGASVGTFAQLCDHPADAPSTSQSQDLSNAPAVATSVVVIGFEHAAHRTASRTIPPPSDPPSRTTQLRI